MGKVLEEHRGELFVQYNETGISVLSVAANFERHKLTTSHSSDYLKVTDVLEWYKSELKKGREQAYSSALLQKYQDNIQFFAQALKEHRQSQRKKMSSN
jgi:hypothetical protein